MTQNQLNTVLTRHKQYLESNGATGTRANLTGEDIGGLDLRNRDLRLAILIQVKAQQADFRGADLSGVNAQNGNFTRADMRGIQAFGMSFQGATLNLADLRNARLRAPNLRGAQCLGILLDGTEMRNPETNNRTMTDEGLLLEELQAIADRYNLLKVEARVKGFFDVLEFSRERVPPA